MAGHSGVREIHGHGAEVAAARTGAPAERLVFGWCSNEGPVAWYRVQQPLRTLNEQGYSCAWSRILPEELWPGHERFSPTLAAGTTVLGQMVATPAQSEIWRAMAANGQDVVYEMDDDIFSIDRANPSYQQMSRPQYRADVSANLAVARRVIVSRRPLADVVRQHTDAPVYIIPNYVPKWLVHHAHLVHPAHAVVVGWAGSQHHAMDWEHLGGRLVQWINRSPTAILHVMGAPQYITQHVKELPRGRVTQEGWVAGVEDFFRRICFDVALIPLRNHVFNESKSWIAALIYGALGIPTVASDVGPYHDFLLHGETGFLFRTPGEMAKYLTRLIENKEMRLWMGHNARLVAMAHTYEDNAWKWAKVLLEDS